MDCLYFKMGEDIPGVGNPNDYTDGFSINDDDYSARGRKIPTKVDIDDVKYGHEQ